MKLIPILLFLTIALSLKGQNLVLNSSLEERWDCPYGGVYTFWMAKNCYSPGSPLGQPFVNPWEELNNPSTPDYFHTCAVSEYTVPHSDFGYQNPKDGNAFGGGYFLFSFNNCLKEYATFTISTPLTEGKEYCFSVYVSLANSTPYAIDNIGAYFTVDSAYIDTPCLEIIPQVQSPDSIFMADTTDNWMLISGSFIAAGGEKYVTLGNFNTDENTDYIQTYPTGTAPGAYYLFDMLSLELCDGTGIEEDKISLHNLYPNPTTGQVSFNYDLKDAQQAVFEVYSISGQLIYSQRLVNQTQQINIALPFIDNGIYFARFTVDNKPVFNEKLVVIK